MLTQLMQDNRILAGLPRVERDIVLPSCEVVRVNLGDIIDEVGEPIRFLHFPLDAAISVTALEAHRHMVEVALTGKEGASGSSAVQGGDRSMCTAMVQIPGTAVRMRSAAVIGEMPRLAYFGAALARHNLLLLRQAVISVGCSSYHTLPQRLSRWLKAHWYRTGIESFPFSEQFLSAQVGVEDPALVGEVLQEFQSRGILKTGRNNVTITDHDALTRQACECFDLARQATDEYLNDLAHIAKAHGHS
jgi:hypothetical protein